MLWLGGPNEKLCPSRESNEALAPRGPDGKMVPASAQRTDWLEDRFAAWIQADRTSSSRPTPLRGGRRRIARFLANGRVLSCVPSLWKQPISSTHLDPKDALRHGMGENSGTRYSIVMEARPRAGPWSALGRASPQRTERRDPPCNRGSRAGFPAPRHAPPRDGPRTRRLSRARDAPI